MGKLDRTESADRAETTGALIVVPTLLPERTASVIEQLAELDNVGTSILVCNSAGSLRQATHEGLEKNTYCTRTNLGFGEAVNSVVASRSERTHRGVLVLNDDVALTDGATRAIRDRVDRTDGLEIVLFHAGDVERQLGAPGRAGALARLSGLWMFRRFLPQGRRGRAAPFYAAYIDWGAWDRLGGFDPQRFPFYFEDADLLRRADRVGLEVTASQVDIAPLRSATSRGLTETIVCEAQGCLNYLGGISTPRFADVVLVRIALGIRAGLELLRGRRDRAAVSARTAVGRRADWVGKLPEFDQIQ